MMWACVRDGEQPLVHEEEPRPQTFTRETRAEDGSLIGQTYVTIPAAPAGARIVSFIEPGGEGRLYWSEAQGFHRVADPPAPPTPEQVRLAALEARLAALEARSR